MDVEPANASTPATEAEAPRPPSESVPPFPNLEAETAHFDPRSWLHEREQRIDRILESQIVQQHDLSAQLGKKFQDYLGDAEREVQDLEEVSPAFGQFLQLARQLERNIRLQQEIERVRNIPFGLSAMPRRERRGS